MNAIVSLLIIACRGEDGSLILLSGIGDCDTKSDLSKRDDHDILGLGEDCVCHIEREEECWGNLTQHTTEDT